MLQYTFMSETLQIRKASKDILARAMAQEDITVRHSATVQTAYFDTKNRVLCLPIWQDMDNAMYDMLVGHEVSHALHTPAEGWAEFVGENSTKQMFLNVVEDARIERMIKDKFPGLRRDFSSAYASLHERDLFEVAGKDISDLSLIDRLNLQFKLGLHCQVPVPFSADEQQYVTRMAETKTFEEVMTLASDLYDLWKQEEDQKQLEQQEQETASEGAPGAGDGEGEGTGSTPDESDESGDGAGSSGAGDDEGDESGEDSSSGSGDGSGEDSGQSMTDDTDDGESADSTDSSSSSGSGDEQGGLDYDDYSNEPGDVGSTMRSFERGVSEMRNQNAGEWSYRSLPTPKLDEIVIDFSVISDLFAKSRSSDRWDKYATTVLQGLGEYRVSIKATVNQMVQQFQMKQAADADKRTEIAKTGVLDTTAMINYRWSEDIFVKNEVHADGKSHGMVMYVDWSGSMCGILQDTIEQLLVLVEFCRKVNIPFEVYAFSSNRYCPIEDYYSDEADEWRKTHGEQHMSTSDDDCHPHEFQLYNFLSNRMNKRQYQEALENLWVLTAGIHSYGAPTPRCLSLGCTPLNEAIWCAMDMVPAFQQANGVQIVNTVFLTDGEGHSMVRGYSYGNDKSFVTDKKTKKNYEMGRRGETNALLNMLRDRTGSNLVGVRLHDSKHIRNLRYGFGGMAWEDEQFVKMTDEYKNQNFTTLPSAYDEYFLVKGNLKVETDALEGLEDDASYTRIKNAFIKGGTRKKSSRVIASRMVDIFAA